MDGHQTVFGLKRANMDAEKSWDLSITIYSARKGSRWFFPVAGR